MPAESRLISALSQALNIHTLGLGFLLFIHDETSGSVPHDVHSDASAGAELVLLIPISSSFIPFAGLFCQDVGL